MHDARHESKISLLVPDLTLEQAAVKLLNLMDFRFRSEFYLIFAFWVILLFHQGPQSQNNIQYRL